MLHDLWSDSCQVPSCLHYYTLLPIENPYCGNLFPYRPRTCLPNIYLWSKPQVLTALESIYSALWTLSNCAAAASSQWYLFPILVPAYPPYSAACQVYSSSITRHRQHWQLHSRTGKSHFSLSKAREKQYQVIWRYILQKVRLTNFFIPKHNFNCLFFYF